MIPERNEVQNYADKDALYATYIRQEVQVSVAIPRNDDLVQVHLHCDVHLHVVVLLVGLDRLHFQLEDGSVV